MATHVKVLGVVFIVLGALGILAAFMAGALFSVFLFATSVAAFVAGIGLLNFKPWARTLAVALAAINLINFPAGTIAGAYGLYVLLSQDGARLFQPSPLIVVP